jgi:prepilin-type N-terminal cleavage/methylation domain-containing protein
MESFMVSRWTHTGFTLIETLIALAMSSVLLASMYSFYLSQKRAYDLREQVAEMQQNVRSGMALLAREIRMAGYNPAGMPGVGVVEAGPQVLRITMDLNNDGDTNDANEDVTYALYDSGSDGDLDLGRKPAGGQNIPVAENIANLHFVYTLQDGSTTSTPANPDQIRRVQFSLTARTAKPDPAYPANGGHRLAMLTSLITPRNLNN